jgi:hypothetical protein
VALSYSSSKLINEFFRLGWIELSVTPLQSTNASQKFNSLLLLEYYTLSYKTFTSFRGSKTGPLFEVLLHRSILNCLWSLPAILGDYHWEDSLLGRQNFHLTCFSGKIFEHESESESLILYELTVLFSSSFCHKCEALWIRRGIPYRKLRCSSLVHLPLYLDAFLSLSYIFESFRRVLNELYLTTFLI